jgi:hypothetical protein
MTHRSADLPLRFRRFQGSGFAGLELSISERRMSLNISSDNTNATSMQSMARTLAAAGSRLSKRPAPDHPPDAAGAIPKAGSPAEQPERPPLHAHPAASTDDSLRRLPESSEAGRQKLRAKKGTTEQVPDSPPRMRCPYDLPPARQRDLDVLV